MGKSLDLFRLDGKTALVTGASTGIGRAIALGLGEAGARLIITARKEPQLRETEVMLRDAGIDVLGIVADVSKRDKIESLVDAVVDRFGGLDILVNNAGTNWIAPAEDYPDAGYDKVMGVNIDGPFWLSREVGKRIMIPAGHGSIINTGSIAGIGGNGTGAPKGGNFIAYHASKGALHSFTRGLAVEWGRFNIRVNTLCPGYIATEGAGPFQESVRDTVIPITPLARYGELSEVKGAAVFLASDAASFVTGHTLVVDGGISLQ
jgi:NAD(P)-dependent dehydrogenase (short-subunit alcohol dehydrogenase family)